MHTLICFEGIDYAGKTSVARMVGAQMGISYGPRIATKYVKKEEEIHKNSDHLARFAFFIEEIIARSDEIYQILMREPVILDRYLLSVLVYHNIIIGRHLEEEIDTSRVFKPDITFLLTINEVTLRNRMAMRPPRHRYESDPDFLLRVQDEFVSLVDKSMSVVIDTSVRTVEETTMIVAREIGKRKFITPCLT